MTDPVKEQLSACLDGELPEAELGLLLKQLQRDPRLARSMGSYSLISEVMREPRSVGASSGFADRVAAAIAEEAAPAQRVSQAAMTRWMRPATGFAIAAGVAALAVISLQPAGVPTQQVAALTEDSAVAESQPAPSYTVPTNVDVMSDAAFVPAARLTNYVVAHSEYSSPLGRRTVLSGVLSDDQSQDAQAQDDEIAVNVTGSADPAETQR